MFPNNWTCVDYAVIRKHEFFGENCVKNFGAYLYNDLAKRAESCSRYDGHMILRDLFDRGFKGVILFFREGRF